MVSPTVAMLVWAGHDMQSNLNQTLYRLARICASDRHASAVAQQLRAHWGAMSCFSRSPRVNDPASPHDALRAFVAQHHYPAPTPAFAQGDAPTRCVRRWEPPLSHSGFSWPRWLLVSRVETFHAIWRMKPSRLSLLVRLAYSCAATTPVRGPRCCRSVC